MSDTQPEQKVCPTCKGSGENPYPLGGTLACPTCNGTGKVTESIPNAGSVSIAEKMDTKLNPTSLEGGELEETIFVIEDYVGGNIEGVETVDRMAFTVFLRETLAAFRTQSYKQGQRDKIAELMQWNGSYVHDCGRRIDGILHHSILQEQLERLNQGIQHGE